MNYNYLNVVILSNFHYTFLIIVFFFINQQFILISFHSFFNYFFQIPFNLFKYISCALFNIFFILFKYYLILIVYYLIIYILLLCLLVIESNSSKIIYANLFSFKIIIFFGYTIFFHFYYILKINVVLYQYPYKRQNIQNLSYALLTILLP